jgi:hypothetical protein
MAVDAAMTCVENGDLATLADLVLAAPRLDGLAFVTPFLAAVHAVLTADPDTDHRDLLDLAAAAAEQGTDTQRTAAAARLRHLARRAPEHATAVHAIVEILIRPVPAEPGPDDGTRSTATGR